MTALSFPSRWIEHAERQPHAIAMWEPTSGPFEPRTWSQIAEQVDRAVDLLSRFGVAPLDRVVTWCENRPEWIIADLAILALGAIHVPIHATLPPQQAYLQIAQANPKLVIVSQAEWIPADATKAPHPSQACRWVCCTQHATASNWHNELADSSPVRGRRRLEQVMAEWDPYQTATILFSSGTAGESKTVALSHANLIFNTEATVAVFGEQPTDLRLCFLPLSHIYARTCDLYAWLVRGSQLAIASSRDTVMDDLKKIKPTIINAVPYFYDRIAASVSERESQGPSIDVRTILGGQIRACFCGGAPLSVATYHFFHERNVPLLPGYGLTECSPVVALSTPTHHRAGTVGRVLPDTQVRIAEDGEILVQGPHVMQGYWQDPQATAAVLRDGWLYTGDIGSLDEDGYLRITGRKKELIVLSTGKKAYPARLEARLTRDPWILQALVVGDGKKYLAALIVPDPNRLRSEIKQRRLWVFSRRGAVRHRQIIRLFREHIDAQLNDVEPYERCTRFLILDRGFTLEEGHLTPKLTLRRAEIQRDFAAEIASLFALHPPAHVRASESSGRNFAQFVAANVAVHVRSLEDRKS